MTGPMSRAWPARCVRDHRVETDALLVALILATHVDWGRNLLTYSPLYLAHRLGCQVQTITALVARLVELGYLESRSRQRFTITLPAE